MKTPDFAKLVETIHERVVQKLGPYGILVEHTEPDVSNRKVIPEFTLKIPDADRSKPGVYSERTFDVTPDIAKDCHTDPKNLDCLPRAWARICADWAPALFDNAPPPPADNVDRRPDETRPEDFCAA